MQKPVVSASLAFVAALAFAAPAFSQDAANSQAGSVASESVLVEPQTEPYGTADEGVVVVHAQSMMPSSSAVTFQNSGGSVFETSSTGDWWGGVQLPSGALALRVELQACDTDAAAAILFGMARFNSPSGTGANVTNVGTTGATPGCAFFPVNVNTPFTVDNDGTTLLLFLNYGSTSATNRVFAFRVYYRLQVSPAPATATFPGDVPTTHPFFRFVEALADAGITGGCGPGLYCPDSAVTRGQMAVFLSTALGLHFAP